MRNKIIEFILLLLCISNLTGADVPARAHIESLQQKSVRAVVQYLKTPVSLAKFNKNPKKFIDEEIALSMAMQKVVATALLQPFQTELDSPKKLTSHHELVNDVTYSPSGNQLASASWDQTIKLWNPHTGQPIRTLYGHTQPVFAVAYSPDGNQLASASWDQTIKLWNPHTGQLIRTLTGHTDHIQALAYSPNGNQLASASWDRTIKLWNQPMHTLAAHTQAVIAIAYSPDGKLLASGSRDGTVKLWDPNTGDLLATLDRQNTGTVTAVAFSPDDNQLALASWDTVEFWNPHTRKLTHKSIAFKQVVSSVAFSPDGNLLAVGTGDRFGYLLNPHTGELIETLTGHTRSVLAVAFSPDGKQLASASSDRIIRLWDLPPDIETLNLEQALYIYYRLQGTLHPANLFVQAYFTVLHYTLPESIRYRLEKLLAKQATGESSCATE